MLHQYTKFETVTWSVCLVLIDNEFGAISVISHCMTGLDSVFLCKLLNRVTLLYLCRYLIDVTALKDLNLKWLRPETFRFFNSRVSTFKGAKYSFSNKFEISFVCFVSSYGTGNIIVPLLLHRQI